MILQPPGTPLFLVMGVPRSGTTALADALNRHPAILCGIERFDWPLARAIYPFGLEDFFDPHVPDTKFHQRNLAIAQSKTSLVALGNKKPRYYVTIHSLLQRQPARLIWTCRNPAHTAASWNARALNKEDKGWQRGMTGLFACMEFVQMLLAFRNLPEGAEALMVDYDALFLGDDKQDVLDSLFTFLGADTDKQALADFERQQGEYLDKLQRRPHLLDDFEKSFIERHGLGDLDPLMTGLKLASPGQLRPHIDAFLERLGRSDFLDDCLHVLKLYPQAPAASFLPSYLSTLFTNAGDATIFSALSASLREQEHRRLVDGIRQEAMGQRADRVVAPPTLDLTGRLRAVGWEDRDTAYAEALDSLRDSRPSQVPAISVVVITWKPDECALQTLLALHAQRQALRSEGTEIEVILVDNGSDNGFAPQLYPHADAVARLKSNTGAYFARNLGSVLAHAPLLLFLEDDGLPDSDLVAAHLREHARFDLLMARGVYCPRTDSPLNRYAGHYYLGDSPFPRFCDLEGNVSILTAAFREVGGWDEAIFFGHGGVELSCRLLERYGQPERMIYTPGPVLHHDYSSSEEHLAMKRKRQASSRVYVEAKHPGLDARLDIWHREYKQLAIPRRSNAAEPTAEE